MITLGRTWPNLKYAASADLPPHISGRKIYSNWRNARFAKIGSCGIVDNADECKLVDPNLASHRSQGAFLTFALLMEYTPRVVPTQEGHYGYATEIHPA